MPHSKEMATHSRILVWKISWIEESIGYSPRGYKEPDTMEHSRTVPHGILPLSYTNTQMPNLFNYRCSFMVDINKEDILKKGLLTVSNADESQIRQGLKSDH